MVGCDEIFRQGAGVADISLRGFPHEGALGGLSSTRRDQWHWGDLKDDLLETALCRRAAAGLISRGEELSLRAGMGCRCSFSSGRGGRQDPTPRIGIRGAEKQFVVHHWTLFQKVSSLSCIFMRGVKRSDPYRRTGAMREEARR